MTLILATRRNPYSGSPLDRAAHRREDADWIAAALDAPGTLWAPVWRSRNLMRGADSGHPEAVYLTGAAAGALRLAGGPWAFLGLLAGTPLFATLLTGVTVIIVGLTYFPVLALGPIVEHYLH